MNTERVPIPPWLTATWELWWQTYRAGHFPHALLITGSPGSGKRFLTEEFVRGVQCHSPDATGRACNACPSCKQFPSRLQMHINSHPDIDWVRVSRYTIGVDDVRTRVIERLALKASYDKLKSLVLDPAERMTLAAANALLKNLEEPPEKSALFLISDQPGRLLPTIRSRCQRFVIPDATARAGKAWLTEVLGADADAAWQASDGRPLAAWQLHEQDLVTMRGEFDRDIKAMMKNSKSPSEFAAAWQVRPPAEGDAETEPVVPMDQRLVWLVTYAEGQIAAALDAAASYATIYAMLDTYRKLLDIRKIEQDAPSPVAHLEEACLLLRTLKAA